MFIIKDKLVMGMALMRILSSLIEFSAAMLMLKFDRVDTAFKINSVLAAVGPTIMVIVTTMGLVGLANKISYSRMAVIGLGVILILLGMRKI